MVSNDLYRRLESKKLDRINTIKEGEHDNSGEEEGSF